MEHFSGDKFRKIKANERNNTGRIISEFNEDFANFAPLKLNGLKSRSAKANDKTYSSVSILVIELSSPQRRSK